MVKKNATTINPDTSTDVKYGFVIDNRKCIGCHACTVACKAEHDVPLGVNRTFVKQVEKGTFPDSKRLFSVMRCNHCTDAPCVDICPTEALFIREDGIVDFDNDRCIGCKSCMQACPYDALYIDPETHTAAKCNYCAHRVDVGLEPACVNVCPEHAIISGNMNDPNSEIAQLLSEHEVKVRKEEKGTKPNLFYIDAEDVSLEPCHTDRSDSYIWNSQTTGVGHFAKFAESLTEGKDLKEMAKQLNPKLFSANEFTDKETRKTSVEVLMKNSKRVFDTPDKGMLWGWEVSGYVWTKAISTGSFLVALCSLFILPLNEASEILMTGILFGLIFLTLTGALLVMDLDQPKRFFYVLLRPHWKSWLVKGGYSITFFGLFLSITGALIYMDMAFELLLPVICITALFALVTAIYTAFLFGQAKGRDLWQSPVLLWHMLIHSIMAGVAVFCLLSFFMEFSSNFIYYIHIALAGTILTNLLLMLIEFKLLKHTPDSNKALNMIASGRYKRSFWFGVLLIGNIIPLLLILSGSHLVISIAGLMVISGVYLTNHIWVEAPQRIPLT